MVSSRRVLPKRLGLAKKYGPGVSLLSSYQLRLVYERGFLLYKQLEVLVA
jgi:hypothetical protein